ncbi:YggT family protein [Chamaesiphon minutus]|uniref:YGGT family protein n=1 Tax=Chamaesiphon minutus (strain ATCC 27169 / PCC 6605) TaxID=1173020 RepID=K9UCN1_CHAP6|nr:YggT family protein [Chamaesiphon minutus]AFY92393.1 YGGT family protein [Chamaesiphon minutus PCC 6605]
MAHDRQDDTNIERRQELQHDEEAFRLRQEEKRLRSARLNTPFIWILNTIFWLVGALEILLGIRFLLRLFAANPQNEFARLINNLSAPFIAPFSTLFISPTFGGGGYIFDVNIAIAIVAYALLSYLAASLVKFIFYHES